MKAFTRSRTEKPLTNQLRFTERLCAQICAWFAASNHVIFTVEMVNRFLPFRLRRRAIASKRNLLNAT
jgi:hypothetical protein